jgi:hypothetical protein
MGRNASCIFWLQKERYWAGAGIHYYFDRLIALDAGSGLPRTRYGVWHDQRTLDSQVTYKWAHIYGNSRFKAGNHLGPAISCFMYAEKTLDKVSIDTILNAKTIE